MRAQIQILAVEDDDGIRDLLATIFHNAGLQARVVSSLQEFREELAAHDANICIIDIGLPDGDGLSLVSELRRAGGRGVIILTGRGSELDHVLGLESGADDYIVKPFRHRELLARLNAVARRLLGDPIAAKGDGSAGAAKIRFHGYEIDLKARFLVNPDGDTVGLTTAEFDVLTVLIAHRGKGLSRDDIAKEVRGATWRTSERAIDGLVSRLRKKLPVNTADKTLVRTLHGVGYMMTPES